MKEVFKAESNTRVFTLFINLDKFRLLVFDKKINEILFHSPLASKRVLYMMLDEWYNDRKATKAIRKYISQTYAKLTNYQS